MEAMRFSMTLALADRPGQLLRALEPIAKNGGNIISIIHERDKPSEGYVPVSLVVDFPTEENFKRTRASLEKMGIIIIKSEEVFERVSATFILVGRIDVRKMIESKIGGARIKNLEVSAPTSKEASVRLDVEVSVDSIDELLRELKRIADEEEAVLISSL